MEKLMKRPDKLLVFFYFICFVSMIKTSQAQQLIHSFETSHGTYQMIEKGGSIGLKRGDAEKVPIQYPTVFPSLWDDLAFIVKKGKLGLYDIKQKREVLLKNNTELSLLPGKSGVRYLEVYNIKNESRIKTETIKLVRNVNDKLEFTTINESISAISDDYMHYSDGISFLDSLVLYNHAKVRLERNELDFGEVRFELKDSIQSCGLFSLNSMDFKISPKYANITYSNESRHFHQASTVEDIHNEMSWPFERQVSEQGVYFTSFLFSKMDYRLYTGSLDGLRYGDTPNQGSFCIINNNHIEIYDTSNEKIMSLQLNNNAERINGILLSDQKIYLRTEAYEDVYYEEDSWGCRSDQEYSAGLNDYVIYDKQGLYIGTQALVIEHTERGNQVFAGKLDESDCETVWWGIYDLNGSKFKIDSIYKTVELKHYTNERKCKSKICDHYYQATDKNGEVVYVNQEMEFFDFD